MLYNDSAKEKIKEESSVVNKKQRVNVGIDIDGVIMDTASVYLRYITRITGKEYDMNDVTDYFFEDCLGVRPEELKLAVELMTKDKVWNSIPLLPGALEALEYISNNFYMYIVTARPEEVKEDTRNWFKVNAIEPTDIVFTDFNTKLGFLNQKKISLDYYVEDRWEFAKEIAETGTRVFLIDYPWNRKEKSGLDIIRVTGWRDILDLLEGDTQ